jgi:uncharacterized protein (TIGR02646 family)
MIQITGKTHAPVPDRLQAEGAAATQQLTDRYNKGERTFGTNDFYNAICGHRDVKDKLRETHHNKCCYCEAAFTHVAHGDVEHFRPKAGWVQDKEPLNNPGYYWLAYDWDNLLFSCQICNQTHKRNHFPLLDAATRANSHQQAIAGEQPVLIHPANENPEDFISFREEIPVAVNGNKRGEGTIKKLGLDRESLNEKRRTVLAELSTIYFVAKGIPDTLPEIKKLAMDRLHKYLEGSISGKAEYAAMLRSFFKNNPVDF